MKIPGAIAPLLALGPLPGPVRLVFEATRGAARHLRRLQSATLSARTLRPPEAVRATATTALSHAINDLILSLDEPSYRYVCES